MGSRIVRGLAEMGGGELFDSARCSLPVLRIDRLYVHTRSALMAASGQATRAMAPTAIREDPRVMGRQTLEKIRALQLVKQQVPLSPPAIPPPLPPSPSSSLAVSASASPSPLTLFL